MFINNGMSKYIVKYFYNRYLYSKKNEEIVDVYNINFVNIILSKENKIYNNLKCYYFFFIK